MDKILLPEVPVTRLLTPVTTCRSVGSTHNRGRGVTRQHRHRSRIVGCSPPRGQPLWIWSFTSLIFDSHTCACDAPTGSEDFLPRLSPRASRCPLWSCLSATIRTAIWSSMAISGYRLCGGWVATPCAQRCGRWVKPRRCCSANRCGYRTARPPCSRVGCWRNSNSASATDWMNSRAVLTAVPVGSQGAWRWSNSYPTGSSRKCAKARSPLTWP